MYFKNFRRRIRTHVRAKSQNMVEAGVLADKTLAFFGNRESRYLPAAAICSGLTQTYVRVIIISD